MAGYSNNEADYDALNKIISNSTYTSTVINGTDVSYKEDDVENVDFDEISNTVSNSVYTNSTGYSVEVKDDPEESAAKYEVNEQLNDLADFNGDGTFDYEDIKAMNDSLRSNTTDYGLTIGADMNGDLIFDEKDIQILTDYYNGKTSGKAFDVEYLKYKNSVLKSGYAKSHNVESLLTNSAIDHTSDVNALIDDYFISKTDFNNDGKIDQNDYVYAMTHKSEGLDKYSDLNGDGVFDDKDINILKTYLDGGDVTQSLNVNQVLMFSCKQDLKDYEAREKEYVDYIEYLESVDASKELINTIKSKKDAIQETMRAIKRRYSDLEKKDNYAFQHYERDMGVYWQKDIDYDKVADYYEEHKNLLNCPELQGKDVDIITVIDYITRERGIPIEHFEAEAPGAPGNGWYWYYDLMSENERKAFQYQYRYNGKSAAMNYFNDLKTELDKRQEGKGAGYNKNKSWARNNKENESDPNYLSKMYKKHQSLIKRIKDLSDEQKKYYHFILDTEGEQAAYDYLENADYSQALNSEYQKNSISTINQTDYVKEYLLTKVDLNNDGKIDQNDYVYATTHRSSGLDKYSDLNGDGKFDDNDLNILKSYLDGKDVSASLDGQSFMKNTYELQNKEYDEKIAGLVKQQEKLKKLIEKLSSGDDYESSEIDGVEVSFTKEEAQKMLDQVSTEISQLKMLIKDNKQMILELPYFNMMMTPEYQEFASNYDCKNINNIDYEQLLYDYEHQGSNGQLGHTYETEDNPVDWFAVIEYLVEEKGLSISDMGAFNTTYIDYMSMDESQRMMYHYLFKTKGKEEASHYFNDIIKDPRRQREAKFRVDRKIKEMDCTYSVDENGNIVDVKLDSSFRNLVSTFGEGMDDAITGNYAGIFKWGEDGYTEEEYEKMYLMQYLAKNDTLNSSYGAGQVGGGVATALVTTAAFTGTSLLTGGTAAAAWAPYLVNVVSIGTAVANQGGEANHYALLNGNSQEAANQYAFQIMKNSLFRQACSSVVGKGIGSSAQFLSLLRGGNSLGFLGNMAVSSANILADASTSVWEKAQEQNLKEALLNEAPLDADSANSQLLEVFMSNVAMGALQQLPTAALSYYRFKKGGETFEFSADDWLSYKNSNPEATAEDFMNFYSGSKVITSDGSFHDTKTTTTSSDYLKQARSTLEGVYRGLDGDSNAVLTDLERKSLKYAVDNMNDADKMELFRYSRAEELDALLDSGIRITDEQSNIIIKRYGYSNRQEMIAEGGLARLSAIDNALHAESVYNVSRMQRYFEQAIQGNGNISFDTEKFAQILEKMSNSEIKELFTTDSETAKKIISIMQTNPEVELAFAKKLSGWIDITESKALKWGYDSKKGIITVDQDWPPYGGMELSSVKGFDSVGGYTVDGQEILLLDRFGSDRGGTYAEMPASGVYSLDERSIFNNPDTASYRQMELNKTKYIDFCDGAFDVVSYCKESGINVRDEKVAMMDSTVRKKIDALATKIGSDSKSVSEAIFGQYGSYTADMESRPDIYTVASASGVSEKYGYVGVAAPWVTANGEEIASGGAVQYNLRTSEATLNKLGIMKSSSDIKFTNNTNNYHLEAQNFVKGTLSGRNISSYTQSEKSKLNHYLKKMDKTDLQAFLTTDLSTANTIMEYVCSNPQLELSVAKKLSGWIDITEPKALKWSYDRNTGRVTVNQDWPPYGGNDITKPITSVSDISGKNVNGQEILYIDRVGGTGGGTYAIMPSDGSINTMAERGVFNNPETDKYRKMEFNKTRYIEFCDVADELVKYCDANGIPYELAATDSNVSAKLSALAEKFGVSTKNVGDAIFGAKDKSYVADYSKDDQGNYNRPEIGDIRDATGQSDKYGYAGTAAPWVTPSGEQIAGGGASQLNLRTGEYMLAKLGIIEYTYNGTAKGYVKSK